MPHEQTIEHGDDRSAFLPAGNQVSWKVPSLSNTLTSPLVARQQPDECLDRRDSPDGADVLSPIPKGKVLLRRQTVSAISSTLVTTATGDSHDTEPVESLIVHEEGQHDEDDSSSDTEE